MYQKLWFKLPLLLKYARNYISKNAMKSPQIKAKKYETLKEIFTMLNA
jgi:hypothetical protein